MHFQSICLFYLKTPVRETISVEYLIGFRHFQVTKAIIAVRHLTDLQQHETTN